MGVFSFMFVVTSIFLFFFCRTVSLEVDKIGPFHSLSDGETLVSKGGEFEFGFFSPGKSKNRFLGIWYKKIPVQTAVWVANRCSPINDSSGLLRINRRGNLVLLYQNKSVVWSTNSSKQAHKPIVQLLDSGNLVLRNEIERNPDTYLWQSFDHPSDTLLPEMKLGWDLRTGLDRFLSSWKSADDPCQGDLSYGIELEPNISCPEVYIRKGAKKLYRSGAWNGLRFSGVPELKTNPVYDFKYVHNNDEVYYTYHLKVSLIVSRIVLNQTTNQRQRLALVDPDGTWRLYSSAPGDDCDNYGLCGGNGNCTMENDKPLCQCLEGFKPKSHEKWRLSDWSEGCERENPLNCRKSDGDEFVKLGGLKLPETTNSWVNTSMSLDECRAKCLSNCSCTAYTNFNIRGQGSGCIIWFGDLIDIRQLSSDGQDLFIRMPASKPKKGNGDGKVVAVIAVATVGVISGMVLVYCLCTRTSSNDNEESYRYNGEKKEDLELPLFDFAMVATATNNFAANTKLGQGGFGHVYKGTLVDGQEIAVKRLSRCFGQGLNEFKNEVKLIVKLQHRNLVKLLGCCIQGEERLLIYEYMPNKSLDLFIFDETRRKVLDWSKRFQIICGIARGILYLHQDSRLRIIHRDLKVSNVLLDNKMAPKISDFGIARTFGGDQTEGNTDRVVGTYGYMAPEYASDGLFSVKSDVFSFGILVLETISGKKNRGLFHPIRRLNLTAHAWRLWEEGKALELIDDCLVGSCAASEVLRCIHMSLLCVQPRPEDRPSMSSVVMMLGSQTPLTQPKQPGFFSEKASADNVNNCPFDNHQESSSTNEITITLLEAR